MDEYQKICEATKPLTDLKEHEELIYANEKLKSLKQDVGFYSAFGAPMTILSLVSSIITIRNPEAINLMCTLCCLCPACYVISETYKARKKYIKLKKELKDFQNQR